MTQAQILKAIALLVRQGKAEHVIIDGKPGIRLINPEEEKNAKLHGKSQ